MCKFPLISLKKFLNRHTDHRLSRLYTFSEFAYFYIFISHVIQYSPKMAKQSKALKKIQDIEFNFNEIYFLTSLIWRWLERSFSAFSEFTRCQFLVRCINFSLILLRTVSRWDFRLMQYRKTDKLNPLKRSIFACRVSYSEIYTPTHTPQGILDESECCFWIDSVWGWRILCKYMGI